MEAESVRLQYYQIRKINDNEWRAMVCQVIPLRDTSLLRLHFYDTFVAQACKKKESVTN
jgi:hypothetical protein